ncbi:MAG: bifunctional adenosylcobinamide kinase/adenosylcobinamide-phosphate guanylyltransferase [Geminicoccaceae bacterium]|nr:bifunctional adenosylcobinamide kinase/adenosylcobinamide-phosphate guanylyltransferase [Geminicoccaceae bacterium]
MANGARLTLVLGGARSGKSAFAERAVLDRGLEPIYIATAEALDDEMAARIRHHRERRDRRFETREVPLDLASAIGDLSGPGRVLLVDCLTLWLTNLMVAGRDADQERAVLLRALGEARGPVVLVSNEVGHGVVPLEPMSRAFVDHAGRLHQALAEAADAVFLLTAGLAQRLK